MLEQYSIPVDYTRPRTKVTVVGCGRWGSFLAWYAAELGHNVTLCGRRGSSSYEKLAMTRKNEYVALPRSVALSDDFSRAVGSANVVLVSVPSQSFRDVMAELSANCDLKKKYIVTCMKGIEITTGKRLSAVALEFGLEEWQIAVWVGPGHVQEFVVGNPNCMLIDGYDRTTVGRIVEWFKSPLIRFYYGTDIIGTEIGAATKNVMGIVAGGLDGMKLSSLKGALMARGSREVARLIDKLGGNPMSSRRLRNDAVFGVQSQQEMGRGIRRRQKVQAARGGRAHRARCRADSRQTGRRHAYNERGQHDDIRARAAAHGHGATVRQELKGRPCIKRALRADR